MIRWLLDTKRAAAKLGVTPGQIRHLLSQGRLRGEKFGRDWLVETASIDEYMAHRPRPGRKPKPRKRGRRPVGGQEAHTEGVKV